jgi:dTDP-4-amino-4,6-dideoxygalactose transaminase
LAEQLRKLRNYGSEIKYQHQEIGWNSRLDELQAAFLRAKLPRIDQDNAERAAIASQYSAGLADCPDIVLPTVLPSCDSVWHLFVVQHPDRDRLATHLKSHGIETLVHYPVSPHMQTAYASLGIEPGALPVAESLHRRVLSLPIWPGMTNAQVDAVIDSIRKFS